MTVYLMFAVNNPEDGVDTGRARAFNFNYRGDPEIALELESTYWDGAIVCRMIGKDRLRIGRRVFPVLGHSTWVGNWCWDGVTVENHVAQAIAEHLRSTGKWSPCAGYEELWDAWESGVPIVFEEQAK